MGQAPLLVVLSIAMPDDLKVGATILWTDNDRPVGTANSFETQMVLKEVGQHRIAAHIITSDDRKILLRETITVLGPATRPAL